ncbi:TetR/AcrR family transcriptional regulator [Gordonia sp. NPDC003424]
MASDTALPRGSTPRGAQRRQELLDAALRLIAREGPGAVTFRSVVEEAHASHGSIRYYFGSREDLIREALAHTATANINALAAAWPDIDSAQTVDDMARRIAAHCVTQMIDNADMGITIAELHLAAARSAEYRPAIVEWGRAFATIAAPTFEMLGSAHPEHDAGVLVSTITGLVITQLAVRSEQFEDDVLAPTIAQHLRDIGTSTALT